MGLNNLLIVFVLKCCSINNRVIILSVISIIVFWLVLNSWMYVGILCKFLMVVVIVIVGVSVLFVSNVVLLIMVGMIN